MRIIFMGTPEFAVPSLERLREASYEIIAVYTQPDKPAGRGQKQIPSAVKRVAESYGLSVLQPPTLKRPEERERIAELCPDIIVVAAFGEILPSSILQIPRQGCLNVHPSLLPRHRGASPVANAILSGDAVSGVSIMLMDKGMDTGPVLTQEKVPVSSEDTTASLTAQLSHRGADLLIRTLPQWVESKITPQAQDDKEATYSRIITKQDGEINWHLTAIALERGVRAFYPWPGCYTRWQGKLLKIMAATPLSINRSDKPGQVVIIESPAFPQPLAGVQTGEGVLGLREVQLEGKRPLKIADFCRGQKGFIGDLLPSLR